jgi:hypothetical protein
MNQACRAAYLLAICLSAAIRADAGEAVKMKASVPGTALKVIHAAMPKFDEQRLDLGKYEVLVVEEESSFTVVFTDPSRQAGQRGSTSSVQTFEVEIRKKDLGIIRANFAR